MGHSSFDLPHAARLAFGYPRRMSRNNWLVPTIIGFCAAAMAGCDGGSDYTCSWDYVCAEYVAGFSEQTAREACEGRRQATFSVGSACPDVGEGGVARAGGCTVSNDAEGAVVNETYYAYEGWADVATLYCPGPRPVAGWSYEPDAD